MDSLQLKQNGEFVWVCMNPMEIHQNLSKWFCSLLLLWPGRFDKADKYGFSPEPSPLSIKWEGAAHCRGRLWDRFWVLPLFTGQNQDRFSIWLMENWRDGKRILKLLGKCKSGGQFKELPEGGENSARNGSMIICTDNAMAESTYFKGSSKSQKLYDMIVDLWWLEIEGQIIRRPGFIWSTST